MLHWVIRRSYKNLSSHLAHNVFKISKLKETFIFLFLTFSLCHFLFLQYIFLVYGGYLASTQSQVNMLAITQVHIHRHLYVMYRKTKSAWVPKAGLWWMRMNRVCCVWSLNQETRGWTGAGQTEMIKSSELQNTAIKFSLSECSAKYDFWTGDFRCGTITKIDSDIFGNKQFALSLPDLLLVAGQCWR